MPGASFESDSDDFDPQDVAETLDESMTLGDDSPFAVDEEMRTFEEMPDVYDVTTARGDRDDDEELALDADEFEEDAVDDNDLEDDDELDYRAADAEHEDDLDGLGGEPGSGYDDDQLSARDIEGLDEVRDADQVEGGEDDVTDFQSKAVSDENLRAMGYSEIRGGEARAKPNGR